MTRTPSVRAAGIAAAMILSVTLTALPVAATADANDDLVAAKAAYDAKASQSGYSYAMQIRYFLLARSYALNDGTFTTERRAQIANAVADYAGRLDGMYDARNVLVDAYNRAGATDERNAFLDKFEAAQQLHKADLAGLRQSILDTPLSQAAGAPVAMPEPWPLPSVEPTPTPVPVVTPAPTPVATPSPAPVVTPAPMPTSTPTTSSQADMPSQKESVFGRTQFVNERNLLLPVPFELDAVRAKIAAGGYRDQLVRDYADYLRGKLAVYVNNVYAQRNEVVDDYNRMGDTVRRDRFIGTVDRYVESLRQSVETQLARL